VHDCNDGRLQHVSFFVPLGSYVGVVVELGDIFRVVQIVVILNHIVFYKGVKYMYSFSVLLNSIVNT
jgi:hypothetical protein